MKGDFSYWRFDPKENFNGVLQQQGKVLLDRDWNEQTRITRHWEDTAGRDAIGAQIAAVPAAAPNGFKIESAAKTTVGSQTVVELTADPGRVWADGLLVYLPPDDPAKPTAPVTREATYLQPPVQDPPGDVSTLAGGVRDCVVLEVWREALNGFQVPDRLIEPALGGPDTTERIQTNFAFRLWRLDPGDDCETIRGRLQDDPRKLGKLTVSLQPTTVVPGDCPVVEGGGYTGFEHDLYRIEIADVAAGGPMFKWSQWNGGLVGRGRFDASGTPAKVTITANMTAIVTSGLNQFYLEAVAYDALLGGWRVTYGAQATLNNDNELELGATPVFGAFPTSTDPVFFRLWNGLAAIGDYTNAATPVELQDGIQLVFDAPGAGVFYRPGDFWTFPVRAGEVKNPDTLINAQPPAGIVSHRVPLAVITWGASLDTTVDGSIEDCRRPFRPLAQLDTCCTFRVGDGVTSTGDFTSIQQAVDALPPDGGEVCVLPGAYVENVTIVNRRNVTISGCGPRTLIQSLAPAAGATADPVILVAGGQNITLEAFAVEADDSGTGILIQGLNYLYQDALTNYRAAGPVTDVTLEDLTVTAGLKSAVRAERVRGLVIRGCTLRSNDETNDEHTVAVLADDALLECNVIEVPALADATFSAYRSAFVPGSFALGGLQLEGLCDGVRVINNLIRGGCGHGITLGSLLTFDPNGNPVPPPSGGGGGGTVIDPCAPTHPAGVLIDEVPVLVAIDVGTLTIGSGGPLRAISIARNRIGQMGVGGIGVVGFFDLGSAPQLISVDGLSIVGNELRGNLRRTLDAIPAALEGMMGYGVIGLADVSDLVIRDNVIADNGASSADPVCGIFVLQATGAEIARNHILENGRDAGPVLTKAAAGTLKTGRRGGIVIGHALAPTTDITVAGQDVPTGTGFPAASIQGNIVTVPVGPALWMRALGSVSVLGNEFTTRGIVQRGGSATILGAAVNLLNLGLSNELYRQFLAFNAIAKGSVGQANAPAQDATSITLNPAAAGGLGSRLVGGEVLFAENQVELNLLATGATLTFAAIALATLDDLSFHGNQCTCDLLDDFVVADAMLFGMSIRAHDNRFTEGLMNALFSAIVLGYMASASGNQATHCLLVRGFLPALTIDTPNAILLEAFVPNFCAIYTKLLAAFGSRLALSSNP